MSPRVLLLGGHGKVSLRLTPKILQRSWDLTSIIRNPEHENDIRVAGENKPGKLDVLVSSIEDVKSEGDAQKLLDQVKPDYVVWSAGAGGKGGPDRTYAIDRDACIHFIRASIATPTITKFLLVSALSSRRNRAPWHNDDDYALFKRMNTEILPHYFKAKLAADEALTVLGEERRKKDPGFHYIDLRPGGLTDDDEKGIGKIALGKTPVRGFVHREDVAEVAVQLLEVEGANGWFDLLSGQDSIPTAIKNMIGEGFNSIEGEDIEVMKANLE